MSYVLFVCNHNAGRSQMAQAFFERHAPAGLRAESAGSDPARAIWPTVAEAMREVGIDLAGRRPVKQRPLADVRAIRHGIEEHVRTLLDERIDEIMSDRTAHSLRLAKLLPPLVKEFGGVRDPAEIRACADAVLDGYADARVRSHVLTLARRRTRECLLADGCDVLAGV